MSSRMIVVSVMPVAIPLVAKTRISSLGARSKYLLGINSEVSCWRGPKPRQSPVAWSNHCTMYHRQHEFFSASHRRITPSLSRCVETIWTMGGAGISSSYNFRSPSQISIQRDCGGKGTSFRITLGQQQHPPLQSGKRGTQASTSRFASTNSTVNCPPHPERPNRGAGKWKDGRRLTERSRLILRPRNKVIISTPLTRCAPPAPDGGPPVEANDEPLRPLYVYALTHC